MPQPAQTALGHCCKAMAWVIAGATGEQPGARLMQREADRPNACSFAAWRWHATVLRCAKASLLAAC